MTAAVAAAPCARCSVVDLTWSGRLPAMLRPQTAAELDRIREAKRQAREIYEWEYRVVHRAVNEEGATQDEVARRLGITQQRVSNMLRQRSADPDDA